MKSFKGLFEAGLNFHGHKCPAMPMGIKAGLAAMNALGVERSRDKELTVISETGKGHAAGCFLDGIMTATGCTYGKSNIEKLYYNKLAFTLIDNNSGRSVRVAVKADFLENALSSQFVQKRKEGVPPQDIDPAITNPLVNKIIELEDAMFLDIGEVTIRQVKRGKGIFEFRRCDSCGELTFVNKLRVKADGDIVCIECSGYEE